MLLHETNKVYLSFTNEFTLTYPILRTTYQNNFLFLRVNRTVTKNIHPRDLKLGRLAINRISGSTDQDHWIIYKYGPEFLGRKRKECEDLR